MLGLKMVVADGRELEFIGSNRLRGALYGYVYYVYKNSEVYYTLKKNEALKHKLCGYITNNIDCMSLEDLEYIKKYIGKKMSLNNKKGGDIMRYLVFNSDVESDVKDLINNIYRLKNKDK